MYYGVARFRLLLLLCVQQFLFSFVMDFPSTFIFFSFSLFYSFFPFNIEKVNDCNRKFWIKSSNELNLACSEFCFNFHSILERKNRQTFSFLMDTLWKREKFSSVFHPKKIFTQKSLGGCSIFILEIIFHTHFSLHIVLMLIILYLSIIIELINAQDIEENLKFSRGKFLFVFSCWETLHTIFVQQ